MSRDIIEQKIFFSLVSMYDFVDGFFFLLKQRGYHVEENPGNFLTMVLFLMFFPSFASKNIFDFCQRNASVRNVVCLY